VATWVSAPPRACSGGRVIGLKESGKAWGISKDDLTPGKVVDYSFDVNDVRQPIEQALVAAGWKLVLVTSRKDASYPKKKGWFR